MIFFSSIYVIYIILHHDEAVKPGKKTKSQPMRASPFALFFAGVLLKNHMVLDSSKT